MANEKRLIDSNALMKAIKSFRWVGVPSTLKLMFDYLKIIIRDQPTVDAVEVVHGEWIMVIDENDCECIECPLCGEQFYDGDNDTFDKPYNYCPNCGAKMDGDGNGN